MIAGRHYTEPTTDYWQRFVDGAELPDGRRPGVGPWRYGYPAKLPDGRFLMLPIRQLAADPSQAVASLISNQAALTASTGTTRRFRHPCSRSRRRGTANASTST